MQKVKVSNQCEEKSKSKVTFCSATTHILNVSKHGMRLLDTININYKDSIRKIELCEGDLTRLSNAESFDLLVISAFPNDYIPTPTSLIGSLYSRGLNVSLLSKVKEIDLRKIFSCWLSIKINPNDYSGIQFNRILCFEPLVKNLSPPELVGDIFQSLLPMTEQYKIRSIAMPILATGDAMFPIQKMLSVILESSINWLKLGLDLDTIKIVAYNEQQAKTAKLIFNDYKEKEQLKHTHKIKRDFKYDYFISYSHKNSDEAKILLDSLLKKSSSTKVFFDKNSLKAGHAWQQELFEALDDCKQIFTLLSPEYLDSKVCKEEYHIAYYRQRESDLNIMLPVYLYSANLPTYMKMIQYHDCREGATDKLFDLVNNHI
ncbi:hypothetical protein AWE51_25660 [Aquimarina aggregata]|uniref:TIR domain-containing protein n=1 Tax=Aquimarina aggregata TaxID=1642818 RepID=A0A162Z2V7_9FLAO|nr:TIR domain-containing protein [Aquimarina aggregata]KZS39521.1 hypothetical protein AWE51_25660 [Aquimarina aggregata]